MKNDVMIPPVIKDEKELYQRYGLIVNGSITPEIIEEFRQDILTNKKIDEKEANALLGELYYSQGNYLAAYNAYNASKINSTDVEGDFFGNLWDKMKKVVKKGQIVSEKGFLDEEQAKFNYFDTLLRLKNNDMNVISMYERSLKKSPKLIKFQENYMLMLETNRKEFEACVKVKIAVGLAYCNSNDKKGYEKGYKILNELFETIESTREFIDNDIANKMIFYLIDKEGNFDKIVNTYYRYLDIDSPNNDSLNIHLGKYLFDNGRYEMAKEHLKRTDDGLSQVYLAKILYRESSADKENMNHVYSLIKGKDKFFTDSEDYYLMANTSLFMYKEGTILLEASEVIRTLLALKEFIEGLGQGKKKEVIDPYYLGELADLYFAEGNLSSAKDYAIIYYERTKNDKKKITSYEGIDDLNLYHLNRGRGLYLKEKYFDSYLHLSAVGNYELVKDELLDIIDHLVDYQSTDYDSKLEPLFDSFINVVRRIFAKKKRKRYPYYANIFLKKFLLFIEFKKSYKLGKRYLKKNISNHAKLRLLKEYYQENKKTYKRGKENA